MTETICMLLAVVLGVLLLVRQWLRWRMAARARLVAERKLALEALQEQRALRSHNEALAAEMDKRQDMERALKRLTYYDPNTGLGNRLYLVELLRDAASAERPRRLALICLGLDGFTSINEILGYRLGDLLLADVAQRLKKFSSSSDVVCRVGSDEFAFLTEASSDDCAMFVAQQLLLLVAEQFSVEGRVVRLTASIGIRRIDFQSKEAEDSLRDAHVAMDAARKTGGAQCLVFHAAMHEREVAALRAMNELVQAIEDKQFVLFYQPLIDIRDRTICGAEALIRWLHPTRGLVSPGEFIKLAEETGYIRAIGSWVMEQACSDFRAFQQRSERPFLMTLNVSPQQFEEPLFFESMCEMLTRYNVPAHLLQLELTESIFLKDALRMGALFKKIRAHGVRIAFDDFGTGYSSLSYLQKFPIDTLKIDQSFVQNMSAGSVNADIVQMIINLAGAMGMGVCAEGVEEPEQAQSLIQYGCKYAQGYLYSRPVPLEQLSVMLERHAILGVRR